jgi:type IV pilus assembly protein PilM
LYRIITLPELPEAVLPEAVRREAKRTIPTPLEEVYFSYQRLPSLTKGETRIFLATFPRNLVDAMVRTLRQAGVKPYDMDIAPLALCRIPNEPRAIVVNARLDHLDVMVIAERLPQVIRRLYLPGEAESLEEKVSVIAEEFKRTVAFYNSSHMENPLDTTVPVFVCGDPAEKPETWQSLVGGAGYTVSALPSPVEVPQGFDANEFMVNIGLALKELLTENEEANFSIVNFNALPEAYVPPRFSIWRALVPVGAVIGIALIVFGVIFVLNTRAEVAALQSEVTGAESRVTQLQKEVTTLKTRAESVGASAAELNSRLTSIERGRARIAEDLAEIERLAREKVTLSNINHTGSSVVVRGSASNEGAIYTYARALRALTDATKAPRFSKVWVSSIAGGGAGFVFEFSLAK